MCYVSLSFIEDDQLRMTLVLKHKKSLPTSREASVNILSTTTSPSFGNRESNVMMMCSVPFHLRCKYKLGIWFGQIKRADR